MKEIEPEHALRPLGKQSESKCSLKNGTFGPVGLKVQNIPIPHILYAIAMYRKASTNLLDHLRLPGTFRLLDSPWA
jgi:hypothetical protein